MASRCINALNELDAVSDKVFYKYSKVWEVKMYNKTILELIFHRVNHNVCRAIVCISPC